MVRSRGRRNLDLKAELLEASDEAACNESLVPSIEVAAAQIAEGHAAPEHEVYRAEHRGGHRDDGLLGAAAALETEEQRAQITVLLAHGGPCGLPEGGFEPLSAAPSAGGAPLAGTLIETRTEARPGDQVS